MAIKYYCDGCDREVPYDLTKRVSVSIRVTGQVTQDGGGYEVCAGCLDHMKHGANPKAWVREAKAPVKTS